MTKFIIRRTIGLIPLLLGVVIISFLLMKAAPGGPQAQFQGNKRITQDQIDAWLKRWCLQPTDANAPLHPAGRELLHRVRRLVRHPQLREDRRAGVLLRIRAG